MEKQHLLSYGFTYGSHSCSYEMRQVCRAGGWPPGTLNRGPGPGDSVGPLCSEGHAVPSQMNLHTKWGHRETVNMVQTRCYFVVYWLNKLIFFYQSSTGYVFQIDSIYSCVAFKWKGMIGTFISPAAVSLPISLISINEIMHRHAVVAEIRNEGKVCAHCIVQECKVSFKKYYYDLEKRHHLMAPFIATLKFWWLDRAIFI